MPALGGERVYLGLGSNLNGPEQQLRRALECLVEVPGLRLLGESSRYRTSAWGNRDQPDFVNAVVAMQSDLAPMDLLHQVLAIERGMGRLRDALRWSPRTIDIDLLYFGNRMFAAPGLNVPHPHVLERGFVLVPLIELGANLADPRLGDWQLELSNLPHDDVVRLQPPSQPQLGHESRPTASA